MLWFFATVVMSYTVQMKKRILLGFIAILSAFVAQDEFLNKTTVQNLDISTHSVPATPPLVANKPDTFVATRVVDGDTIIVLIDGVLEKIRIIGVDTPETVDSRKSVQCFGRKASEFTKLLLENKTIWLEDDPTQGDRDKYKRLLRYVFLTDGTLVNQKIISEGYGHEYTYRIPYKYQTEFRSAERNAREYKKGLWADGACDA